MSRLPQRWQYRRWNIFASLTDLLITIEVQVPRALEGKALDAIKTFAQATAHEDVRAEFAAKARS